MRRWAQVIALAALMTAPVYAVRISGELVARFDQEQATFTVNGPNFSLVIPFPRAFALIGPFDSLCQSGACGPGDLMETDFAIGSALGHASGTIDGIFSPRWNLGDASTNHASAFFGGGPTITVTNSLIYSVPVELTGRLAAYAGDPLICVLCVPSPSTPDGLDSVPIFGSGRVIVKLREADAPNPMDPPQPFQLESVTYLFEVPEPATFVMAGSALALILLRRRKMQVARQPESLCGTSNG